MITKEYKLGADAREAVVNVARQIGDILGKTLGPSGRNYLLPMGITNDGRSIVREIRFNNEAEDLVAAVIAEVAEKTDKDAGDGTTTSLVLATQLIQDMVPKVADVDSIVPGADPVMELTRALDAERDMVLAAIQPTPVTTLEELERVAFTSMENVDAAKIVASVVFEAGKDSLTVIEDGFTGKLETEVMAGFRTEFTNAYGTDMTVENVPVLVVNHHFETYGELTPFLTSLMQQPKEKIGALVIVAKQYSIPFLKSVSEVVRATKFPMVLLSNTALTQESFEDVAAFCGATLIDTHPKTGRKIHELTFADTGFAKKVIATGKQTAFIGGHGLELGQETTPVQSRVMTLRAQLDKETSPMKREALEKRIALLLGGIATIFVDAKTAPERVYLKLKVQDAMNSCKHALEGGMIRGGGLTLKEIAERLDVPLLKNTLLAPYTRIQRNHGAPLEIAPNVMDSYPVIKAALENAVSVAKYLLTTEGVIANKEPSLVEGLKTAILQ